MENGTLLLEMRHMQKSFPGVMALRDVSLSVRHGTVHALMGENGAGKSTLMKCLFGIYHEDAGEILLEGTRVRFQSPREALSHGVAMVHQELNQALRRNIMDNIWLGRYPTRLGLFTSEKEMLKKTKDVLENLGISLDPRRMMSTLSVASRQMVEIAKAVSYDAKVIVLDEPTSSLTESEIEHLFRIIDLLKKRGCGIIYISHKMEEILRISDDITVMRDGTLITTEPAAHMTMEKIIRLMVGRELSQRFPPKKAKQGEILLEAKGISSKHQQVQNVSLTARRGEIVGLAGLAGAGRSEFFENIFGISARASGELFVNGKPATSQAQKNSV